MSSWGGFNSSSATSQAPRKRRGTSASCKSGATQEQVLADILATSEFLEQASSGRHEKSGKAYIQVLYRDLLDTSDDQIPPRDLRHWLNELHRVGREGVALEFLQSDAYRTLQIDHTGRAQALELVDKHRFSCGC